MKKLIIIAAVVVLAIAGGFGVADLIKGPPIFKKQWENGRGTDALVDRATKNNIDAMKSVTSVNQGTVIRNIATINGCDLYLIETPGKKPVYMATPSPGQGVGRHCALAG